MTVLFGGIQYLPFIYLSTLFYLAAILGRAAASVSSSEAASLGGNKALTPIISGSICGGLMFLAWTIALIIYFKKRYRRRERRRLIAVGKATPKETDMDIIPQENVIIPPDPAVLLGHCKPGEIVIPESRNSGYKFRLPLPWSPHESRLQKGRDETIAIENISFPDSENPHAVHDTTVEANEEDAIVDEMTVPMKV